MNHRRPLLPLAFLLVGCGGGGGGKASDGLTRVTIDWPARARGFAGSPLARSAIVRFANVVSGEILASSTVVRPDGDGAVTKSYALPERVVPGTYQLSVLFCAGNDALATDVVGFGTTSATVRANGSLRGGDGEPLGDVAFSSNLKSLAINPGQIVNVGQKTSLFVSATTQGDGVVAIPFSAVRLTVVEGSGILRANGDGTVTGLAPGTATVVASAFGVTSLGQTVTTTIAPQ